jgi:hypothetical protein
MSDTVRVMPTPHPLLVVLRDDKEKGLANFRSQGLLEYGAQKILLKVQC